MRRVCLQTLRTFLAFTKRGHNGLRTTTDTKGFTLLIQSDCEESATQEIVVSFVPPLCFVVTWGNTTHTKNHNGHEEFDSCHSGWLRRICNARNCCVLRVLLRARRAPKITNTTKKSELALQKPMPQYVILNIIFRAKLLKTLSRKSNDLKH